jgi:hypothetical protein
MSNLCWSDAFGIATGARELSERIGSECLGPGRGARRRVGTP